MSVIGCSHCTSPGNAIVGALADINFKQNTHMNSNPQFNISHLPTCSYFICSFLKKTKKSQKKRISENTSQKKRIHYHPTRKSHTLNSLP